MSSFLHLSSSYRGEGIGPERCSEGDPSIFRAFPVQAASRWNSEWTQRTRPSSFGLPSPCLGLSGFCEKFWHVPVLLYHLPAMLLIQTVVKKSPIHGKGLFAAQDVPEGTVVWEFDEKSDLELPAKFLQDVDDKVNAYVDFFGSREGNTVYIDGDDTRYMNHSRDPNVRTWAGRESMFASRFIKKGEELLCDYREFDEPSREGKEPYV